MVVPIGQQKNVASAAARFREQVGAAADADVLKKANNLSDVSNLGTVQDNLQLSATFSDLATAQAATIPARNKRIRTQFYSLSTLKGGANYKRVATQPTHAASFRSTDRFLPNGSTDNTNGGWWVIDEAVVTPYMVGAIGDGTTNDFAAVQAALYAAKIVCIPSATFGMTGRLRTPNDRYMYGEPGAAFSALTSFDIVNWPADQDRGSGTQTTAGYNGWSNITLQGFTIEVNGDTRSVEQNVVTFNHGRDCRAIDLVIRNTLGYHALEFNGIERGFASGCRIEGYRTTSAQVDKEAIQIDAASSNADSGLTDGTYCKQITIRNCVVTASAQLPAHPIGIGSHGVPLLAVTSEDIVIEDCYLRPVKHGIQNQYSRRWYIHRCNVADTNNTAIRNFNADNVKISECYVENSANHSISILGTSRWGSIFENNIMFGNIGIYLEGDASQIGGDHKVRGNTTYRTASYGFICGRMRDSLVSENLFEGAHYPAGSSAGVMHVSNANSYVSSRIGFEGNRCVVHGGGTEAAVGLSVSASQVDIWAFGNDFKGYAAATSGTVNTTSNRV